MANYLPRKNKGFENSKSLNEKTVFDGKEAAPAPREQMEKIGYDGTMQALGSPGDEERRMHGYNVQKMTVKSSKVHKVACFPMTQ